MSKNKAELLADARKAGITGLTQKSTVKEIQAAIKKGPAKKPSSRRSKPKTGEQLQAERLERSRANRAADVAEKGQAEAARAQAQIDADAAAEAARRERLGIK